jgi:hypothetical protein
LNRTLGITAALALGLVACEPSSTETLVARAGDYEFTVADAVELLGPRSELPNQPQVVGSLAELWIDYTLLADATLRDTTYAGVDVSQLVDQQAQGEMILELQESVIQPDTSFTEEELRELFQVNAPGIRVSARHILLGFPPQSTQAQRDSVRAEMVALLQRIRAGEDFETLARNHSQDRGSGAQGGDLGEFGAGEMVAPFEEAAFALEPGEVSDVVESPYGLHVIQVYDKTVPTFDESRDQFRFQMQARAFQEAESVFVAGIRDEADPQVREGAVQLARDLARNAMSQLTPRAANRVMVEFQGGEVTVGEFVTFLETRPAQTRQQIIDAPDDVLENELLLPLAQRELFIQAARDAGLEKSEAYRDSVATEIRAGFRQAASVVGLAGLTVPEGSTRREVVESAVTEVLLGIVSGSREVVPLGPVGFSLRQNFRNELFEAGMMETVNRIEEIRGAAPPPSPAPDTLAGTEQDSTADTTGGA